MTELFLQALNRSISAGWLVLAVVVLRMLLQRAPKGLRMVLWGLVGLRLILPFSVESVLSLIPSAETVSPEILYDPAPAIHSGISALNQAVNPVLSGSFAPNPGDSVNPLQVWIPVLALVWLVGIALMLTYTAVSYVRLYRKMRTAVLLRENIFQSEQVTSPFVLGFLRPNIYLPFRMEEPCRSYVIAHEQAHIRQGDPWWKLLGFLLLTVYWFNSLIWLAYVLFCRDIELACDERVIRGLEKEQRAAYSQALLAVSTGGRRIAACPLAFGEVSVKGRVRSVLHYRKPSFWLIAAAVVLCAVTATCFLTDPKSNSQPDPAEVVGEYAVNGLGGEFLSSGDPAYAIGANAYGMPVFRDTDAAFQALCRDYADALQLIAEQFSLKPVSRSNWDGYKIYGWQVSTGDEQLQANCVAVTQFFDLYENSFTTDHPIASGSTLAAAEDGVREWFDGFSDPEQLPQETLETTSSAFPGVTFRATFRGSAGMVEAMTDGRSEPLLQGMPVWNVYFTDLTGDGAPEICATVSYGSGIVDTHVVVADYAGGQTYTLWERGVYDYALTLKNGALLVTQSDCGSREVLETGVPVLVPDDEGLVLQLQIVAVPTHSYTFRDTEEPIQPTVSLFDDGTFSFTFSVISSYWGRGSYELENDRLTLRTDDGMYVYVFDVTDDAILFDAGDSSQQLWFSGLYDGAVLEQTYP